MRIRERGRTSCRRSLPGRPGRARSATGVRVNASLGRPERRRPTCRLTRRKRKSTARRRRSPLSAATRSSPNHSFNLARLDCKRERARMQRRKTARSARRSRQHIAGPNPRTIKDQPRRRGQHQGSGATLSLACRPATAPFSASWPSRLRREPRPSTSAFDATAVNASGAKSFNRSPPAPTFFADLESLSAAFERPMTWVAVAGTLTNLDTRASDHDRQAAAGLHHNRLDASDSNLEQADLQTQNKVQDGRCHAGPKPIPTLRSSTTRYKQSVFPSVAKTILDIWGLQAV